MKTLRAIFTSNLFLAVVAVQVFIQVWSMVVDMPILGMILGIWLSWRLGCLAGWADILQRRIDEERSVAADLIQLQADFDELPEDARLALATPYSKAVESMTRLHQFLVEQRNQPYVRPRIRDFMPSPTRWLARRRERQIMATAKVVHS